MFTDQQKQLYHQTLMEHHKQPFGFGAELEVNGQASGENAACGDEIEITCAVTNNQLKAVAFSGHSCAICRASASLLCSHMSNIPVDQAHALNQQVIAYVEQNIALAQPWSEVFSALSVVQQFPVRKQCAVLPWTTLKNALNNAVK